MKIPFRRGACAAASWFLCGAAAAQGTSLAPVTVTANPLGAPQTAAPVSELSGTGLLLRQQGSLGETLNGVPGVSSTYFGPAASRPVIRGLDGDRIRILENGGALRDVSGLSYDHAVSMDPIAVERIEVLRGPGALLYGGNAVGGVVNLVDNRIPTRPLDGVTGRADASAASANRERQGAVMVEGGTKRIGLHVDAFGRRFDETRVPVTLPCTQDGVTRLSRRICNSDGDAHGGAVGASAFFDKGYLGASVSDFRSGYGSVAEDEVRLDVRSRRVAVQGEVRNLRGALQGLKLQALQTDYRHTESEAGVPGTVFRTEGHDVRLEARHAPLGPLEGLVGLHVDEATLSAQGAEAFVPPGETRQRALFVYEELGTGWGKLTFGARTERVSVESFGDPELARFTPGRRTFRPASASLGSVWNLNPSWQATGTLSRTQRAPKDYELFSDGPHVATAAYELGNAALGIERSTSIDLGVQWKAGAHRLKLSAFQNRFRNYIALLATGLSRDAAGNGAGTGATDCGDGTSAESGCTEPLLPEFAYQQVSARLRGLEAEGSVRLLEGANTVDLELRGDLVRADNLTLGQPLPRIAPVRLGATAVWGSGPWGARLGFDHWARQARVPAGDAPVAGYTLWNAALTYKASAGSADLLWFLRLDNLGDRLAYSATSILTQSAPGRVPLPGRSVRAGVRMDF
ncbi:TonB-dependent receptor [Ramlibacter henchirensis]|uniref:TonB-dependent receptor n=1 Tax=Ramlibacter henchirensis TaxID=204072 RepID=A0A4Z0C449_9BURK|nr:TonB-dependent receptor [Ramlibacter henchirensis]TFZ06011.1 TonB-dependent receptor [Ramlibacter henchirensis]